MGQVQIHPLDNRVLDRVADRASAARPERRQITPVDGSTVEPPSSQADRRRRIGAIGGSPDRPTAGRARTAQCRSMNGTRTMAADAGPSQTGTPTPPISYATPTGDRRQGAQLFTDPTGWTLHQLRHTRIRQLKDEGCPLPILHRPPAPHTALTPPTAAWWWCRARCRTGRPAAGPRVARPQRRSRRW